MSQNKSLSTQEVADILHVSKSTIYDLIKKGEIHSYKIGRKVRFTQDDVDAYIARSRHEHSTRPVKNIDTHSTLLTPEKNDEPQLIISGQDVVLDILANYLQQEGVRVARTYLNSFDPQRRNPFLQNRAKIPLYSGRCGCLHRPVPPRAFYTSGEEYRYPLYPSDSRKG
jgi:excisionase family DNA binding protein